MSNPVLNIVISQGFDFEETFQSTEANGTASNLAGFTASSVLKKHSGSSSSTPFSVTITGNTGTVAIAMTSGKTVDLTPGRYVYDVRLVSSSGKVSRLVEGMALVTPGITTS